MRELAAWMAIVAISPGCVLYSKDDGRCRDEEDSGWTAEDPGTGDGEEPGPPETSDPEPAVFALALDPNTGMPGETVLASLTVASGTFDLGRVAEVDFAGASIAVLDLSAREDEVLLVLEIAADAVPGPVDVYARSADAEAWILDAPFEISSAAGCPATGGDPTGSAGDTGCP